MAANFKVEIFTPTGKYFSGESEFLSVTSSVAVLGILPDHAPLITTLEICKLTIKMHNKEFDYAIGGGVMHIKNDHSVILLVDSIERSDEIDINRAKEAQKRAEERLAKANREEIDVKRAEASLARALNRISVYKK